MPKTFLITAVNAVVCLVVWRGVVARERFQNDITKISVGMATTEVIQILGQPREVKKPCYSPRPVCDQDLVYPEPFNFVSFWTVSLDQSGHVIESVIGSPHEHRSMLRGLPLLRAINLAECSSGAVPVPGCCHHCFREMQTSALNKKTAHTDLLSDSRT